MEYAGGSAYRWHNGGIGVHSSTQLEHGVRETDNLTPHIIRQLVDKRRTGLRVD